MNLTIAIPTFNRAARLEKGLLDLLKEINGSVNKFKVRVLVSNNGSKDDTEDVIAKYKKIYLENNIIYTSRLMNFNQGFDANVLACYASSQTKYIWFMSDDDNLMPGIIDKIFEDITCYQPSVIYYNHNQEPYTDKTPYIKITKYYDNLNLGGVDALKKIVMWPKLSAIVLRKCDAGLRVPDHKSWFAHVSLAMQCGLVEGGILHSSRFNAFPDADYMDHIQYPPYIGNDLDICIKWVLDFNNRMDLYEQLMVDSSDPLILSLNALGAYYRGKHSLTDSLRRELWSRVGNEIRSGWFNRLKSYNSWKELIKFPVSIALGFFQSIISKKNS